ncbi:putative quinol monooxygenase [Natronomonas salsuginis]|uniref:Antibiotic biosynthesis monooxygenase n=1 Tax=Natronomonas salsuginis TaxID=2217661 RepID=A0A4U5JCG6_9EURY|nr:putative quinol monooxygenase [Natronomonas salsuginis]TKR25981.1 antibiotic biosynthesis monooxygenase [Natronomonas salsuginis]
MLVVRAMFPIDPDRMDEALELVNDLVDHSNQEPGIIDYRAAVDVQDETRLRFIEQYEDGDAFEAHIGTEHFQAFESKLPELLAGELEVTRFTVSDATELEL